MKKNNKGFTLAELLIVVAIIAVLVAIAIPVFTTQLERSREATDIANVRSAYATVVAEYLATGNSSGMSVSARQTVPDWQGEAGTIVYMNNSGEATSTYSAKTTGSNYAVTISIESATGNAYPTVG